MAKKILIIDDSALMRRAMCDIITSDNRFHVEAMARDGLEGFKLLTDNKYDAVVLDINMPRMDGLQLLRELQKYKIKANILMASTLTKEGAKETIEALELGALDFIEKPNNAIRTRGDEFKGNFLNLLDVVSRVRVGSPLVLPRSQVKISPQRPTNIALRPSTQIQGNKVIAIASSTGGPRALHSVIPKIPKNINAPVLVVQHMPADFTKSLADRLNTLSEITVKEAENGDRLECGCVYISAGGKHMKVQKRGMEHYIQYSDEPPREGVKPCANYMYESLENSSYKEIICAVLTGMGADGTKGIVSLEAKKKVHIIAQNEETCAVYGMPKAVVATGLVNEIAPIEQVANAIIKNVGVH